MAEIRQYLISLTAAAILCGIARSLSDEKTPSGTIIRLIAGIVLSLTVISPLVELQLGDFTDPYGNVMKDARQTASAGDEMARDEISAIINQQMEAYILDKAASYGVTLTVTFGEPAEDTCCPEEVILQGRVSPYAKSRLQRMIEEDLGIAKENQRWIG